MNHQSFRLKSVLIALLIFGVTSCSGSESQNKSSDSGPQRVLDSTDSDNSEVPTEETTAPETTTPTTVAPISLPPSPEEDLALFGFYNSYSATSQVSSNPCGQFAIGLDNVRPHFLEYTSGGWVERPKEMTLETDFPPDAVKGLDLNSDGVLEFAVFYNSEKLRDSDAFGMIFYQEDCVWAWAKISYELGGDPKQALNLAYDETKNELYGYNVPDMAGYLVKHTIRYLPQSKGFIYEPIQYEAPPYACVSAFSSFQRINSPDLLQSFNNRAILKTLQSCREGHWIMEAKRFKSEYEDMSDAYYYGERFVILKNESASDILDFLCNYVDYQGRYPFRTTSPVAIACD